MKKIPIMVIFLVLPLLLLFGLPSLTFISANSNIIYSTEIDIQVVEAFPNLEFSRPVDFQINNLDSNRIYVVEQSGRIIYFDNSDQTSETIVFFDHRSFVDDSGNEQGLLGLVFHPNYSQNGFFFVHYTVDGKSRISRFSTDPNTELTDTDSEEIILEVTQPFSNHNAGQIAFGLDGYLYIGLGDGGSGGDPLGNGQNLATLLGSILRVDVDSTPDEGLNYKIPIDNPFHGESNEIKGEIFAYGLRNPWRFSIDPINGNIWLGDVGQNLYEEVDLIVAGGNYGWNTMEGFHCYSPSSNCDQTDLMLPIVEYDHSVGFSITGGYVYRGESSNLFGKYVFADYGSGSIMTIDTNVNSPTIGELIDTNLFISSFGVDHNRELYILAFDGKIYKFTGEFLTETISTTSINSTQSVTTSLVETSLSTSTETSTIISSATIPKTSETDTSENSLLLAFTLVIASLLIRILILRLKP